ncbi:hypothetical protein BYT27DRAFT_7225441 [Phlegmacium glaucopus]|nr:hypothetical protein BYT27DRAFT_7225441 [Phlegmacium glaucopus]
MKPTPELLAQASSHLNPDFTDNAIITVGNLLLLKRLHTLLLASNRNISPSIHLSVPSLEALKGLQYLKYISLLGNPERAQAKVLFVIAEGLPTALATTVSTTISAHSTAATLTMDEPKAALIPDKAGWLMSKEDQEKVKAAIANATSIEVRKLERS